MMTTEKVRHVQQTLLGLGDEFLVQYFLTAHSDFRKNQILSRLFSMGHSLELYLKAALVSSEGIPPFGHDVPALISSFDPTLALSGEVLAAGEAIFAPDVTTIDLGLWKEHEEALELYQAEYFVKDLKYYLMKDQRVIFPARKSLKPVNSRYLDLVRSIRASVVNRHEEQDRQLVELVGQLGFEYNPAQRVVGDGAPQ